MTAPVRQLICLFLCLFLAGRSVPAQSSVRPLRFISTNNGLPQSLVSCIVQDEDGFIWISTLHGLTRFDGLRFKLYLHDYLDARTIASSAISSLYMDKANQLWIRYATTNKVDRMNPRTGAVEHLDDRPLFRKEFAKRFFLPTADGHVWGYRSEEGICRYDLKTNQCQYFTTAQHNLPNDTIFGMTEDKDRRTWLVSRNALCVYQPENGRFQMFPFPVPLVLPVSGHPVVIHQRSNSELMVVDVEKLVVFNPKNHSFRTFPLLQPNPMGITMAQPGPNGSDYFASPQIIYQYSDAVGIKEAVRIADLSVNTLLSLLTDRSGLLWLGLNTSGICQIDISAPAFDKHPNESTFPAQLLQQYFHTDLETLFNWPSYPIGTPPGYLLRSAYDNQHRCWLGLNKNLTYFDAARKQWTKLPDIPAGYVRGLDFDADGQLWVINQNSTISQFDSQQNKWVKRFDVVRPGGTGEFIKDMMVDEKTIYLTTLDGLQMIDKATGKTTFMDARHDPGKLPSELVEELERDPTRPGLLWIGTYEGLVCLDKRTLKTQIFSTQQGLPDNTIYSIQSDDQGFLWLGTNRGLCRFDPITHVPKNFTVEDGLPCNEYNRFHHLRLPDGRLVFGGMEGWVLFDTKQVLPDTYQPQIAFTGLRIFNQPVDELHDSLLLGKPLNQLAEMVLPYDQNTLTFEFAGLEYNQPSKLKYRYQLLGIDDKWVVTENPSANYTKLQPGKYQLQINCTNTWGAWSQRIRTLYVTILPPWWRTWWAYLLYIGIGLMTGYVVYRLWLRRVKAQQQLVLQQKEAAQLKAMDEMKTRFFSNITHEFRTPLSLILGPAEQMQKEIPSQNWTAQIGGIERNARKLLRYINQLLDMSKLEADSMQLTLYRVFPNQFVAQLLQSFDSAAADKGLRLTYGYMAPEEEYLLDTDKLYTILSNVLSNAIKFTAPGGEIRVEVKTMPDQPDLFQFVITDTGIGIPATELPFIFNRFYQAHAGQHHQLGGTGIGLALAKELAELMKGTLSATSEPNVGTNFTLALPMTKPNGQLVPEHDMAAPIPKQTAAILPILTAFEPEPDSRKPLILVTEDNEELRNYIGGTFRPLYRVITAANGKEGLQLAMDTLPDVIVSDWLMPEMDGVSFCKIIKENPATNHIAFVLVTGKSAPMSRIEGLQSQADDYLTKPFVAQELLLRIANILQRRQQLQHYFQQALLAPEKVTPTAAEVAPVIMHPFLQQLYGFIDEHLSDADFSVEKLATLAAMSVSTLSRKLASVIDLSAAELIKQYRLSKAATFLKEGKGVAETGYLVGYDSPTHFSTIFKNRYGISPKSYGKEKL